ncbi:50S ribosomal protein L17 [candidate division WWE3 bacterium]|jgi:large subunit ribosomal protein L17|uniref:50S ribosomal protein L17 n=1 Tax=candidate division WWE3 bacterium TaxID=2053526 RepID=A0A3A4ZE39_UNCKA|nr:MAG: 50S ribosomal protein L17 [candidate division WWE3 bacterium]
MRHRVNKKRINRDKDHMRSLLMNLSTELIIHEKVETTLAKAKLLKPHIEKMITYAGKAQKTDDKIKKYNVVRNLNRKLGESEAIKKLVNDIAARFQGTPGGYTRIVKVGNRQGDNALLARIEFTKDATPKAAKSKQKKNVEEKEVKNSESQDAE